MATRNLTRKFLEIRNNAKANRSLGVREDQYDEDHEGGLLKSGQDSSQWRAAKNSLPPQWVDQIDKVEEDLTKIQFKIGELENLHKKRLKVNFESDENQQERAIENKTSEVTEVFHHAELLLKRFGKQCDDPDLTGAEKTVRKNMQSSIAKKLQGLSTSFRSTQKKYMNNLQNQKKGGGSANFGFLDEPMKAKGSEYVDSGFNQEQMNVLEDMELNIDQRDEEIMKIAKSIEELAQIFRELAVLVIDQGTILDRIDYNMENAVENVKQGVQELEHAEDNQKNSMSVRCIMFLLVLIAVMVGILIWKHSSK